MDFFSKEDHLEATRNYTQLITELYIFLIYDFVSKFGARPKDLLGPNLSLYINTSTKLNIVEAKTVTLIATSPQPWHS